MLRTARFGLLIRHDDAGREFAYDSGTEKALAKAKERGWTVVSMQNDFKVVFDLRQPGTSTASGPVARTYSAVGILVPGLSGALEER